MRVKQQHSEPYMEQQTHLNLGKEFKTGKAVYCHPAYLTYMKCEMPGWMNHKLESRLKVKVAQSCPILCNPMDCIVHGILQARILEWVAFPFSRGSFQTRG